MNALPPDERETSAKIAIDLARDAQTALDRGDYLTAKAHADLGRVYIGLAFPPIPTMPAPRQAPETEAEAEVCMQEPLILGPVAALELPAVPASSQSQTPSHAPDLLIRAHKCVVQAGGKMYSANLAEALGMTPQALGSELSKILREAGVRRPGKGTVRVGTGQPFRLGFLAETLEAAIAMYHVKAAAVAA
ncbi:hypothetical protein ABH940_003385 [Streptacidiphilus sp. BW17]|uniref:hypothetical protein n=1 Tax=Streptacidiphilus sp. BW17 TaxID=3156274 RepID=UPI003511B782